MVAAELEDSEIRAAWTAFVNRVAEAEGVARASVANMVTAFASVTLAIVGATVTLTTAQFEPSPIAKSMLCVMVGAGSAAAALLVALAVEAFRAAKFAEELHELFSAASEPLGAFGQLPDVPRGKVTRSRISVNIRWKMLLPGALLVGGGLAAVVRFWVS